VLTHFHLDHAAGPAYLPGLRSPDGAPPQIWGPGEVLFRLSSEAVLRTLLGPPCSDADFGLIASAVWRAGRGRAGGWVRFALRTRVQPGHSTPTLALRFGDALAYGTDTPTTPRTCASRPVRACSSTKPGTPRGRAEDLLEACEDERLTGPVVPPEVLVRPLPVGDPAGGLKHESFVVVVDVAKKRESRHRSGRHDQRHISGTPLAPGGRGER
jgi:hypothetical protein